MIRDSNKVKRNQMVTIESLNIKRIQGHLNTAIEMVTWTDTKVMVNIEILTRIDSMMREERQSLIML